MTIQEMSDLIVAHAKAKVTKPLFFLGHRGMGKTVGCRQAAKRLSMPIVELRPATIEEADFLGVMYKEDIVKKEFKATMKKTNYATPHWILDEPFILFLDETNRQLRIEILNSMTQMIEPTAQIGGIYKFNSHQLPAGSLIVMAGNPNDGNYDVTELDPAWADRTTEIEVEFDFKTFYNYITKNKWNTLLIKFLETHPDLACQPPSKNKDEKTPSPRAWESINVRMNAKMIDVPAVTNIQAEVIQGDVGSIAATTFVEYVKKNGNAVAINPDDFWKDFTKFEKDVIRAEKDQRNDKITTCIEAVLLRMEKDEELQKDKVTIKSIINFTLSKKIPDTFRLLLLKKIVEGGALATLYTGIATNKDIIVEIDKICPEG